MLVTLKINEKQAEMLKKVQDAKGLNTRTSAILLCIAEVYNSLFIKNYLYKVEYNLVVITIREKGAQK